MVKEYIVRTVENVGGTYRVSAESPEDAIAQFKDEPNGINWDRVEQIDYNCFGLEVDKVEEI